VDQADQADQVGDVAQAPGEVVAGRTSVLVGTGSGLVELGTVQPPGKRAIPAPDWARGARLEPGERFD
jgi:methionyl-tRNA formyltransferase